MSIVTLYEFIGREAASRGRRARQQDFIMQQNDEGKRFLTSFLGADLTKHPDL
jgi:dipeptidyl aminopeptidase/acylaminoacyl peptidase